MLEKYFTMSLSHCQIVNKILLHYSIACVIDKLQITLKNNSKLMRNNENCIIQEYYSFLLI